MKKKENISIQSKNSKYIVFILFLIVILLVVYAISIFDKNRRAKHLAYVYANETLQDNTRDQKNIFTIALEEKYKILHIFSRYIELKKNEISDAKVQKVISRLSDTNFDRLFIANKKGIAYSIDGLTIDVSQLDFFKKSLQGKNAIEIKRDILSKDNKFIFSVPIFSKDTVVGAVFGSSSQKNFEEILVSQAYSNKAYSFVCDESGTIIIKSNHKSAIEQKYNIFDTIRISRSAAVVATVKNHFDDGKYGEISYTLNNKKRYATYTPLGVNNWFMFNVVPESVIDYDAQSITKTEFISIGVIIVVASFIILCVVVWERSNNEVLRESYEELVAREEFFRIAMRNTTISMWEYDIKRQCIIQNDYALKVHGFDKIIENVPESLVQSGFVHPDSINDFYALYKGLAAGEAMLEGVFCIQNKDKTGWNFEHIEYTTLFNQDGEPYRAIGVSYDVSEKQKLEQAYKTELHYLQTLTDDVVGMAIFDLELEKQQKIQMKNEEENILFATDSLRSFFASEANFIASDVKIKKIFQMLSYETIQDFLNKEENREFEYQRNFLDGIKKWIHLTMHFRVSPHNGHHILFIYSRDIDEQKRKEEELLKAATTDSLTNLYNHEVTLQQIDSILHDTTQQGSHALFVIDLDRFKKINDTLGHQGGDHALCTMAAMLQKNFRTGDVLGRIGGDEFIAFMKNVPSVALVESKASELVKSLHILLCGGNNKECVLSASIGVAFSQTGDTVQTLYKKADAALYTAKAQGRNGYALAKTETL